MDEPTVVSLFTWLTCVVWSAYIVIMVWERHLFLAFCTFFLLGLFVYFAWLILYYLFIYTDLRLILPVLAANALTSFDFNPCQPAPLPVGMIPGVDLVQLRCILDSLSKAPIPSRRTDLFVKATPSFGSRCLAAACLLGGPQPNRDVTVATWYQAPRFESFQCCRNSFGFLFSNKIPNEACPIAESGTAAAETLRAETSWPAGWLTGPAIIDRDTSIDDISYPRETLTQIGCRRQDFNVRWISRTVEHLRWYNRNHKDTQTLEIII